MRFFDADGRPVASHFDDRVIGIGPDTLRSVPPAGRGGRRAAAGGGRRKHNAIRAALVGGWVNVLITDTETVEAVLAD